MRKTIFLLLSLSLAMLLHAKVELSPAFNSNMVLQRDMALPVWGKAAPGEKVTVAFQKQQISATADTNGKWMVKLAPVPANASPSELTVRGKENTITLKNILVGEVWLCGGQSNMQMPMWTGRYGWTSRDGDKKVKEGANKLIRITTVPRGKISPYPMEFAKLEWAELNADNGLAFSATAFYFGQELFRKLNVPIGLISSNVGGTRIEPWTPPVGFNSVPELAAIAYEVNAKLPGTAEYKQINKKTADAFGKWLNEFKAADANGKPQPVPPAYPDELRPYDQRRSPTVLYNAMIHSLTPLAIRGAIWYQGCSNMADGALYRHKMQALLNGWRKVFNQPQMPFYFVQLAPYAGYAVGKLPLFWETQQRFAAENGDNVRMAVINDAGEYRNIHPADKYTVGKRLSLLALKYTYGKKELKADSPELLSWKIDGSKFILDFRFAEKLTGKVANFEVSDVLGNWYEATGKIDGKRLIVYSDKVKEPFKVRYLWQPLRSGTVFNEAGLPLGAFTCGKDASKADIIKAATSGMNLIYQHNMLSRLPVKTPVKYLTDNSKKFSGKVKKVAYLMELTPKKGEPQWVLAAMDAFDQDVTRIGVPSGASGIHKACIVKNLEVYSNVPGVATGVFQDGNIEFWRSNYSFANAMKVPGANPRSMDFGDSPTADTPGYGCMQVHNYRKKQTVFAYNCFHTSISDIGIGNSTGTHPDWTFSRNSGIYKEAKLTIFAGF